MDNDFDLTGFLDRLAHQAKTAEQKNAVHACRPGHPLGNGISMADKLFNARFALTGVVGTEDLMRLERLSRQYA